jgi:hypothetical protein
MELNAMLLKQVIGKNSRTIERVTKVFVREVGEVFGLPFVFCLELGKVHVLKKIVLCAFCAHVPTFYDLEQLIFTVLLALNVISHKLFH